MLLLSEWGKRTVRNHLYDSEEGYLILVTSGKYKARIKLDFEIKDLIKNHVWSIRTTSDEGRYLPLALGNRLNMLRFVYNSLNGMDIHGKNLVLLKHYEEKSLDFDLRLSNLTNDYKETYKKEDKLKSFQGTFEKTREKLIEGIKNNRYDGDYSKKLREGKFGSNNISSKLDEDTVTEIRRLADEGYSHQVISEMYDVFRTTVSDIVNYRIWNPHLMDSSDVKDIDVYKEIKMNLNKNLENLNLNLDFFEGGKGFIDEISGRKYLTCAKEKQLYVEVLEDDTFIYSFHLRLMEPSGRNKWRNYGIISMIGDKNKLPKRDVLYKIFEELTNNLV